MSKFKKGFTLIEVLAVIVILAIIALITTPIINKYIHNSKYRSFESSIYSMFREFDYEGTESTITVDDISPCQFQKDKKCRYAGTFKVVIDEENKKKLIAKNVTDGEFCANGGSEMLEITDGYCGKNDTTAPIIANVEIVNITTYSAEVITTIIENEGNIIEHQYRLLDSNGNAITDWITGDSIQSYSDGYISRKKYKDLTAGTKYYVEIKVSNNSTTNSTVSKLYSNGEAYSFTTSTFTRPTITYSHTWETNKIVHLNYDSNVRNQYKIITEKNFKLIPWNDLTGDSFDLEVINYHYTVIVKSTDGNTTYYTAAQIGYVDNKDDINNTEPLFVVTDYKNNSGVNTNEIGMNLSDTLSGVKSYCVSTTNDINSCSGTGNNTQFGKWVTVSNTPEVREITKPHVFINGGTYYTFVQDYVGNKSKGYEFSFNRIHYDLNGGTGNVLDQVKVKNHTLVITDTIPTRVQDGIEYEFLGWDPNKTAHTPTYPSKSNYTKNEDVTLYAIWRRVVSVHYDSNEGTGTLSDSTCYRYNNETNCKITLANNAFTRNGYTFRGWALGKSGATSYNANTEYTFTENIKVYAGWEANALIFPAQTINVTFNTTNQNITIPTLVSNGNGNYTYSEKSETNGSTNTSYFTISNAGVITMNKLTPVGTYTYTVKVTSPVTYNTQNINTVQIETPITIVVNQFDIGSGQGLIIDSIPDQTYTRYAIRPTITVKLNGTKLTENTDYTYAVTNNVNVGTAKVTVSGIGNYKGTKLAYFTIVPYDISGTGSSVAAISALTYNGSNQYPKPKVTALNKELTETTEVKYTFDNNKNAGTGTVTMTGQGNYTGTQTKTFTINKKSIDVVWGTTALTFNNDNQKPTASIDTTISNENMTLNITGAKFDAGEGYTATASCASVTTNNRCANYTLTNTSTTFKISPYDLSKSTMASVDPVDYNGTDHTPKPQVKAFGIALVNGTDFTYSYNKNRNAGTATVTANGKGNYTGNKSVNFTINRIDPTETTVESITSTYLTYNGKDQGLVGVVNISNAEIYYSTEKVLNINNYRDGSKNKPNGKNVKVYTVYWYAPADNYNAQSGSITTEIKKKTVDVSWTDVTFTYDGASHKPTASTNTETGETITFNVNGAQTNYNASAYTATASCASVDKNSSCSNYTLNSSTTSTTFRINQRSVTYKADNQSKTYDGTALGANAACTITSGSLPSGHTATCSNSGSQTYAGSSAKSLNSVTIKVNGTNVTSNYNITRNNGTLTVNKRDVTIKASDQQKLSDGTPLNANETCEVASGSLASGDSVTCTASGSRTDPGSSTKTLNTVKISRSSTDVTNSYNITKQNGTITIIPTTMTLTFDKNGGDTLNTASKTVEYNKAYGTLATSTRYGYNFAGWYTGKTDGTQVTSSTIVSALANHTLYAHWTPKSYTCGAGYYVKSNTEGCQTCPAGYYCGGVGPVNFGPTNQGLSSCPSGYTSSSGATAQSSCYINVSCGYYKTSSTGSSTSKCSGGSYNGSHTSYYGSSDSCSTCPSGSYCGEGACSPTSCGAGTYNGSTGQSSCSSCPSGFTSNSGATSINSCYRTVSCGYSLTSTGTYSACSSGYYSTTSGTKYYGDTVTCTQCPSGSYCSSCGSTSCPSGFTSSAGASSINSCYRTVSCGYSLTSTGTYSACSSGYYSTTSGTKYYGDTVTCTKCPANSYCSSTCSATSCPSRYTSSAGSTSSTDCKISLGCGETVSTTGSTGSCKTSHGYAPTATVSLGTSRSCTAAGDGYEPTSDKCGQQKCSIGYYGTGGTCTSCPSGYTTGSTGTTSKTSCYKYVGCGYKVSKTGTETACTSHGYAAAGNVYYDSSRSCTAAGAGYRPTGDKCGKEACPANTYGTDGATCTSCPSGWTSSSASTSSSACKYSLSCGYSLTSSGSVSQCAAGTYSGTSGTKSLGDTVTCSTCPAGKYCPKGSCSGTSCPSGKTSSSGAKKESDCYACTKCPDSSWTYSIALGKCTKEIEASCAIGSGDYDWNTHDPSGRLKCYKKNCVESACSQSNRNETCASAHCTYYAGTTCSTSQYTYNTTTNKCVMSTSASC